MSAPSREMTLEEYVAVLPKSHRAAKEYAELRAGARPSPDKIAAIKREVNNAWATLQHYRTSDPFWSIGRAREILERASAIATDLPVPPLPDRAETRPPVLGPTSGEATSPALKEIVERMRARAHPNERDMIADDEVLAWADEIERAASLTAEQREAIEEADDALSDRENHHAAFSNYERHHDALMKTKDARTVLRALLEGPTP